MAYPLPMCIAEYPHPDSISGMDIPRPASDSITDVVIDMGSPDHPTIVISLLNSDRAKVKVCKRKTLPNAILHKQRGMWMEDDVRDAYSNA